MRQSERRPLESQEPTDREVVERVLAGDREIFRVLVRRYQDMLYRHALRMTRESDVATDLVQASMVKAYASIAFCRDRDRFGAWLYRILANACKDHLKSRRRRDVSLDDETVHPIAASNPQADVERSESRAQLESALARLPDSMREAFVLKHVEGMPYEEIAEMMNTSVSALKMRVHRARELLKQYLMETR
ncbi:MAG TPA: sigma-70 family RNA polymerase sigma factor [Longimicrobiales bacterium]